MEGDQIFDRKPEAAIALEVQPASSDRISSPTRRGLAVV